MADTFKQKVLRIINRIPPGKVTTYGTIALLAGIPRGGRVVGGILHQQGDKTSWHRVVNCHGFISTRCPEHSRKLQKALLEQEGIEVTVDFMINLQKYGWWGKKTHLDCGELEK